MASVSGRRILVVDDSVDSADSLALLLRMLGHTTMAAHDGEAALQAMTAFHPEIVLLDIGLPRLNGYEVARRLREMPGGKSLLLIALTGYGQDEDRRRSVEAGFDYHLTKPLDLTSFQVILRQRFPA